MRRPLQGDVPHLAASYCYRTLRLLALARNGISRMTIASQRVPTWYVTSPHGTRVETPTGRAEWQPFGVHHARQAGSILTACGKWAVDWEVFWDLPFPSSPGQTTCRPCLLKVAAR